ncbi:MAG: tetratricopeptide repeat protein, partial [Bacteroidia bacterium]|nr:tetratricopeptide repeat protein [Bacteroidia bacterium]
MKALLIFIVIVLWGAVASAQQNTARKLFEAAAYDEAIQAYKKLIEKNADDKNAIRRLAYCYWQT